MEKMAYEKLEIEGIEIGDDAVLIMTADLDPNSIGGAAI